MDTMLIPGEAIDADGGFVAQSTVETLSLDEESGFDSYLGALNPSIRKRTEGIATALDKREGEIADARLACDDALAKARHHRDVQIAEARRDCAETIAAARCDMKAKVVETRGRCKKTVQSLDYRLHHDEFALCIANGYQIFDKWNGVGWIWPQERRV